jgi:hypothetical protein
LLKEAIITLVLNNHVVHDHTSNPDLPHGVIAPCFSKVSNNSPV